MVEGVILATGLKPIPKEYAQGMTVPFQLTVCDQFRNEISVESKLSVDRSTTPRPKLVRSQSSLRESGKIPETREPFGTEPGRTRGPVRAPTRKPKDEGGNAPLVREFHSLGVTREWSMCASGTAWRK